MSDREEADGTDPELPDELAPLVARLRSGRPQPSPALRGRLRMSLAAGPISEPDRARVKALIVRYAAAGTLLLVVGALVTFL